MDDHQSQESDDDLNAPGHGSSGNAPMCLTNGVVSPCIDRPHLIGDREGRIRCILGSACTHPQGNRGHKISTYVTWHSGNVCRECSAHFCCNSCNLKHRLPNGQCNLTLFKGKLYAYELWEAAVAHRQGIVGQKRHRPGEDFSGAAAEPLKTDLTAPPSIGSKERRPSQLLGSSWLSGFPETSAWLGLAGHQDEQDIAQAQALKVHWLQQQLQPQQQQQQQQLNSRLNASSGSSELQEQVLLLPEFDVPIGPAADASTPADFALLQLQIAAAQRGVAKAQHETLGTIAAAQPGLQTAAATWAAQSVQNQQQSEDALQENALLQQQQQQRSELQGLQSPEGQPATDVSVGLGGDVSLHEQLIQARREAAAYKREAAALRQVLATAGQFCSAVLPMLSNILAGGLEIEAASSAFAQAGKDMQQLQQQLSSTDDMQQLVHAAAAAAAPSTATASTAAAPRAPQQQQQHTVAQMHLKVPAMPAAAISAAEASGRRQEMLNLIMLQGAVRSRRASLDASAGAGQPPQRLFDRQQQLVDILLRAGSTAGATHAERSNTQQDLAVIIRQAAAAAAAGRDGTVNLPPGSTAHMRTSSTNYIPPDSAPLNPRLHTEPNPSDDDPPGGVPGVKYRSNWEAACNSNDARPSQHSLQQDGAGWVDPVAVAADLLVSLRSLDSASHAL